MIRFFSVVDKTATGLTLRVDRQLMPTENSIAYIIYDTDPASTGLEDYYIWRCEIRATPSTVIGFEQYMDLTVDNTTLFPPFGAQPADYMLLNNGLLKIISVQELEVFSALRTRIDTVRARLPNPGTYINDTDGIGDGGIVAYAGGYYKKFSVEEYLTFIQGALIEINITAPKTEFWWEFFSKAIDLNPNPYMRKGRGIPTSITDLLVLGASIRAMYAWGLLEVDMGFQTNDSGLAITFQRAPQVAAWVDKFINDYNSKKAQIKMDFVCSTGVGVGTSPFYLTGLWGKMVGMTSINGTIALNSLLGFDAGATRPS